MKKQISIIVLITFYHVVCSQVQDWSWVQAGRGNGDEVATHMTIDASGDLIVTGYFSSPSLALSTVTLVNSGSSGTRESVIAKYDGLGNLLWAKRGQGSADDEAMAVTTDPTGNIYVVGNYESPTITFGTVTLTNNSAFSDIFEVKYDPSGNVLWARSYGGNLLETVRSVKADNSGNSYFTGSFRSLAVSFGTVGVVNSANNDAFLVKVDVNGTPLWAKQIGGAQDDNGLAVTCDLTGNVYVLGDYNSGTLSTYTLTNAGAFDIFLGKYDGVSGNLLAVKTIGGSLNESGNSLAVDASGNLYLAGTYESVSLNLGSVTLTNASSRDMMMLKMNSSLAVQWANRNSGNLTSSPSSLFSDQSAGLYMSGNSSLSSLVFPAATLSNPGSGTEGFFAKFDLAGTNLSAKSTLGTGDEQINGIVADANGNVFVCGSYNPTVTLGQIAVGGSGGKEFFVAKLCMVPSAPVVSSSTTLCPRQTATLTASAGSGISTFWYNTASGGSTLAAGPSFTVSTPGTFYAGALNPATGCSSSSRSAVSVSVQQGPSVSVSGTTITSTPGSSYKWIECHKDSVLPGATSQTFAVVKTGYYAVVVTNNGCVDTSSCKLYSVNPGSGTITVPGDTNRVDISEFEAQNALIEVFPNPNRGNFTVRSSRSEVVTLTDLFGREIRRIALTAPLTEVRIDSLPAGIYLLQTDGMLRKKIIVSYD
jgi:hypothetical protein